MNAKYTPFLLGTALLHSEFNRTCKLSHNISCHLQAHDASHMLWLQHKIRCELHTEVFLVMFCLRLLGVFIFYFMDISIGRICLWLHSWWSLLFKSPYLPWKDKKTLCSDSICTGHSSHRGNYPLIVLSLMACEWLCGTWSEWTNSSFRLGPHACKW